MSIVNKIAEQISDILKNAWDSISELIFILLKEMKKMKQNNRTKLKKGRREFPAMI